MAYRASIENGTDAPETWSSYMNEIYRNRNPPTIGSFDVLKLEQKAREVTRQYPTAYMYTFGSAGTCSTADANLKALQQWRIIPRMLRDATERTLETTIFGVKYKCPVFVAPVGVQGILHPDGELATARAAAKVGVPFIMSTASTRSIEDVAEANGSGQRWYQLYWPRTKEVTLSLLGRAKKAGFTTLVVTLDTMLLGWRPHDLDETYLPFMHGVGIQVGTSDPVFMARFGLEPRPHERPGFPLHTATQDSLRENGDARAIENTKLGYAWLRETNSGIFRTWDELAFLRQNWDGPIVLKGIQCIDDAHKALDYGIDGIVVSNHGGRQVDGGVPAFWSLEQVMSSQRVRDAQATGKFAVLFDSGVRTGSDCIKALAMGAQAVLLARPFMYALAIGGEEGVKEVLRSFLADTEISLGLSGYKSVAEVQGKKDDIMVKLSM